MSMAIGCGITRQTFSPLLSGRLGISQEEMAHALKISFATINW
jgi:DNA-binding XRE family transcriptional regulator